MYNNCWIQQDQSVYTCPIVILFHLNSSFTHFPKSSRSRGSFRMFHKQSLVLFHGHGHVYLEPTTSFPTTSRTRIVLIRLPRYASLVDPQPFAYVIPFWCGSQTQSQTLLHEDAKKWRTMANVHQTVPRLKSCNPFFPIPKFIQLHFHEASYGHLICDELNPSSNDCPKGISESRPYYPFYRTRVPFCDTKVDIEICLDQVWREGWMGNYCIPGQRFHLWDRSIVLTPRKVCAIGLLPATIHRMWFLELPCGSANNCSEANHGLGIHTDDLNITDIKEILKVWEQRVGFSYHRTWSWRKLHPGFICSYFALHHVTMVNETCHCLAVFESFSNWKNTNSCLVRTSYYCCIRDRSHLSGSLLLPACRRLLESIYSREMYRSKSWILHQCHLSDLLRSGVFDNSDAYFVQTSNTVEAKGVGYVCLWDWNFVSSRQQKTKIKRDPDILLSGCILSILRLHSLYVLGVSDDIACKFH